MQIEIRGREIKVSEWLHKHIERRVHFALERFSERIRKVRVQVRDLNGPRGGVDKSCQLVISLVPASTVVLETRGSNLYGTIDCLADRAATSIVRRLKRTHGRGRSRRISKNLFPGAEGRIASAESNSEAANHG